jgi:hypothetical protein
MATVSPKELFRMLRRATLSKPEREFVDRMEKQLKDNQVWNEHDWNRLQDISQKATPAAMPSSEGQDDAS